MWVRSTHLVVSFNSMFEGCVASTLDLDTFVFSDLVTNVYGMFTKCTTSTLNLTNVNMVALTTLSGMFEEL